jgi:hypothetical protein
VSSGDARGEPDSSRYRVSKEEALGHLREQLGFIRLSSRAYDEGVEAEAKRLATAIRVVVHDGRTSVSLLTQLELKRSLRYVDTAEPINPRSLLPTAGLVTMRGEGGRVAWVAPLERLSGARQNPPKPFEHWWSKPVSKAVDGRSYTRADYVLTVANKEGGAHVDPTLDAAWVALTRSDNFGWEPSSGEEPMGNVGLASVRQIAYEVETTIRHELAALLEEGTPG